MTRHSFLLFILFSISVGKVCAQVSDYTIITDGGGIIPAPISEPYDERHKGLIGNPNLFDDWTIGSVYLNENPILTNVKINYHLLSGKLLFQNEVGKVFVVNPAFYDHIEVGKGKTKRTFVNEDFLTRRLGLEKGMLIELKDESGLLLVHRHKRLIQADYLGPYAPGRHYDEFIKDDTYFVATDGEMDYEEIKIKWSSLKKILPPDAYQKARESFRERNLKLTDEVSLLYAIKYALKKDES